jgi:AraC-like DNA-binding protein
VTASSTTLRTLITRALYAHLSVADFEAFTSGADKHALLDMLLEVAGLSGVFEAGRGFGTLPQDPLLDALSRSSSAAELMRRWMRLERFGHATHRTVLREVLADALVLQHVCKNGSTILAAQDMFIWGVMMGLSERVGFVVKSVHVMHQLDAPGTLVWSKGMWCAQSLTLTGTSHVRFQFEEHAPYKMESMPGDQPEPCAGGAWTEQLQALISRDLLVSWTIARAALVLRTSSRQLQRMLREQGTSFTQVIHRQRLEMACAMIRQGECSLTEIAFCTGFSDSAHFTRIFRRYMDVPPMAYRDVLHFKA